ncbi:DUF6035 family protein [Bosea sp. CS1GBMeth4]|uniref:DUF6035 family protein n=1 Tax=Bosea sp. CS1GBMeth4 TaxID=1892849 RepID=UPI0016493A26|nr:DUF6035 family protein [Bosea sp. CS1GBMeth4]
MGNVTINPLDLTPAVKDPELAEVLDLETGEIFNAVEFIGGLRYDALVKLRADMQDELHKKKHRYQCAWCSTPAYIVASSQKRFFFRHIKEDGSCPAKTRGASADEILARKYFGQREGAAHQRIKRLIERSLAADPNFTAVALEKTWRSASNLKARRQPDVQATRGDQRLAFEVQLSTTFLSVVAGRRNFYRDQGGLLVWVMGSFSPDYRRMTTDDLLFPNNSNILVVDEETTRLSEASGAFHVRAHYRRPVREGAKLIDQWDEKIARFQDLTFDQERQRAFLFDYEAAESALKLIIKTERTEARARRDEALRSEFFEIWSARADEDHYKLRKTAWRSLWIKFRQMGIRSPEEYGETWRLHAIISALLSAKAGTPVGWGYKSLIEVAHHLETNHKDCVIAFGYALDQYGHRATLEKEDKSGRWQRKLSSIREKVGNYDPDYWPDEAWTGLICFLFPEIRERLEGYIARMQAHYAKADAELASL